MQFEWFGQSQVVATLKPYLLLNCLPTKLFPYRVGMPGAMSLLGRGQEVNMPGRYTPRRYHPSLKVHPQKVHPFPGSYTPQKVHSPVLTSSGSHQSRWMHPTGMLSCLKKFELFALSASGDTKTLDVSSCEQRWWGN